MDFRWIGWNIHKCLKHGVRRREVEFVVRHARRPYPRQIGDEKTLVHGQTEEGRYLQVIYLLEDDDVVFVIHAMPLTERMKKRYRRSQP
jgi:uncharacterized DUF497 family protein